jgi:hypothetical protein
MLKYQILILFLILGFQSLTQNDLILDQVKKLNNDSLKTAFLEAIFYEDQLIRNEWIESMNSDSLTQIAVLNKVGIVDSLNLLKIDYYLEYHHYPSKLNLSNLAVLTPWLVIHHATYNYVRIKNYSLLSKAYLAGDVREEELKMYMARTLSIEEKKEYDFFYKKKLKVLMKEMKKLYDRYSNRK